MQSMLINAILVFFSVVGATQAQLTEKDHQLLNRYKLWKEIVQKPSDYQKVFSFFYEHPDWPMFFPLVKIAENNIKIDRFAGDVLKWFRRYPPITGNGIIAYASLLMRSNRKLANTYINQTWIYQNLAPSFAEKFRKQFSKQISPVSDAKRTKRLAIKKDYKQLQSILKIAPDYLKTYIESHLNQAKLQKIKKRNKDYAYDPDTRYSVAKSYAKNNQYKLAAEILMLSNEGESLSPVKFFNLRREVACNIARAGHPLLAYRIIALHCLNKLHPKQKKYYVKAEWFAGFLAFRFLNEPSKGLLHFKNAYEYSNDAVHKSKNAFWIAEIFAAINDSIAAFDWYKKSFEFFNTFYGQLSENKLKDIFMQKFLALRSPELQLHSNSHIEQSFNNRELVKVLRLLNRTGFEHEVRFMIPFYQTLIDDIDDPHEEKLLITLAASQPEIEFIEKTESKKQKYFSDSKTFKVLKKHEQKYVTNVNADPCFLSLVHSIIKRESYFNPKVKSPAGAIGLMQIMPATAKQEMKRIKFYTGNKASLYNVPKNLTIGSSLLNRLLRQYDNNLIYTMYAYNAGEGNAAKFIKSISNLTNLTDLDIIELIPLKETRLYVKNILYSMIVYQKFFEATNCYSCNVTDLANRIYWE